MHPRVVPYKHAVAATFVVALFMDLLDITIVHVALPTLGRSFGAGPNTLEWVVTAYLLSLAVWVPASGWLGDRFGSRRIFRGRRRLSEARATGETDRAPIVATQDRRPCHTTSRQPDPSAACRRKA
jgi:hypothetical protein